MDYQQRQKRVRLLVSKVNKERKKQAKKIDILCNDMVEAQRSFIKKLEVINFTANFYESIVGLTDLGNVLYMADQIIKEEISGATVGFLLRQEDNFELHVLENDGPIDMEKQGLESYFTPEVVDNICKANKLCNLDDMFAMGLQANPAGLNDISAITIPLGQGGASLGFILIYQSSREDLKAEELENIVAITQGLSKAIQSSQMLQHSSAE